MSSICSSCRSPKGANTVLEDRGTVPYHKGEKRKKSDLSVSGIPINERTGNPMGPTPPGHKSRFPVFASIPKENPRVEGDEDKEEEEEDIDEPVEFKQLRAQVEVQPQGQQPVIQPQHGRPSPTQRLMSLIKKHDNRKSSFEALFGGPESDYNGVV